MNPWGTATQFPSTALYTTPIDSAFEPQTKFTNDWNTFAYNADWSGAAPVQYPWMSGSEIASGQFGAQNFAETTAPSAPDGIIRTPQDIATAPSPVNFQVGATLENTIPAVAFNGAWTGSGVRIGLGSLWFGNVSAINENGTNIGWEYDPNALFVRFGPTQEQFLAQNEEYERTSRDIIAGLTQETSVPGQTASTDPGTGPASVAVGNAPAAPDTFAKSGGAWDAVKDYASRTWDGAKYAASELFGIGSANAKTPDAALGEQGARLLGNQQTFEVTGYFPCSSSGCKMEGGLESARPGPDGQSMVRTLDDYRLGKSEYVTGASDASRYGEKYIVPEVTYRSPLDGKEYTLESVPVAIHDTGGAFAGRPDKLDIAVGVSGSDSQAVELAKGQAFLGEKLQTYAQVSDVPARGSLPVTASLDTATIPLPAAENPRIPESAYERQGTYYDLETRSFTSPLHRVETGTSPLPVVAAEGTLPATQYGGGGEYSPIPLAEWVPKQQPTGEEIQASIENSMQYDDRIAQAEQETAAYQARLPDIDTKSPEEMKAIEQAMRNERVAQAQVESPEPPRTPTIGEQVSAWWDKFRGVSPSAESAGAVPDIDTQMSVETAVPVQPVESAELPPLNVEPAPLEGAPVIPVAQESLPPIEGGTAAAVQGGAPDAGTQAAPPAAQTEGQATVPLPQERPAIASLPANVPLPTAAPLPKISAESDYKGGSVVDYLKSIGQDSSYVFRKQVASSFGITNFRGTATQNAQLLNCLRGGECFR
jgi:hypothetical protein